MTQPSASHACHPIAEAEPILESAETDGRHIPVPPLHHIHRSGRLDVGDDVSTDHGASTIISDHCLDLAGMQVLEQAVRPAPMTIRDDEKIDAGVRILSGEAVCSEAIVSTSAFVGHDVKPQRIAGRVPALFLKGWQA